VDRLEDALSGPKVGQGFLNTFWGGVEGPEAKGMLGLLGRQELMGASVCGSNWQPSKP
jgi:hypothetical protein